MTRTLIVHVIRTNLIPFIQSRASWQLPMTTLLIMGVGECRTCQHRPTRTTIGVARKPSIS